MTDIDGIQPPDYDNGFGGVHPLTETHYSPETALRLLESTALAYKCQSSSVDSIDGWSGRSSTVSGVYFAILDASGVVKYWLCRAETIDKTFQIQEIVPPYFSPSHGYVFRVPEFIREQFLDGTRRMLRNQDGT